MKLSLVWLLVGPLALMGCVNEQTGRPSPSTDVAVAEQVFPIAFQAADICADYAPDWNAVVSAFASNGYREISDQRRRGERVVIVEDPASNVKVLVGLERGEGACIVGFDGMTPQQSVQLAQRWANRFGASVFGEGDPSRKRGVLQTWRTGTDAHIVRISAYSSSNVLDTQGSEVRLWLTSR